MISRFRTLPPRVAAIGFLLVSSAFGSVVEPFYRWNKTVITVCWIDTDRIPEERYTSGQLMNMPVQEQLIRLSEREKRMIKESIESNYSATRTGISFAGWKNCSDSTSVDAIIYTTDSGVPGSSSIGRLTDSDIDGRYAAIEKDKLAFVVVNTHVADDKRSNPQSLFRLNSDEYLKFLFLHEFGHLAGLRHEHLRRASRNAPMCIATGHLGYSEKAHAKTRAFDLYDDASIMSYCYLDYLSMNGTHYYTYRKEPSFEVASRFDAPWHLISPLDSELPAIRKDLGDTITENFIRIQLSEKDAQGLRCLYSTESERKCERLRVLNF